MVARVSKNSSWNKFLEDLANNTPNEEQFKEKNLGKVKRNNRNRRQLQVLSRRNSKHR
jgi:hypothetical protein